MGADHGSHVRVGPFGSTASPATTSTLSLAFAARNAARYSPSMSSDRSRRAAMIGIGTNPAVLIARAVLTRQARSPLPGNTSCTGVPALWVLRFPAASFQRLALGCHSHHSGWRRTPALSAPRSEDQMLDPAVLRRGRPNRSQPRHWTRYAAVSALVAQRIEHLTTDQKVGGSSPSERATYQQVRAIISGVRGGPAACQGHVLQRLTGSVPQP